MQPIQQPTWWRSLPVFANVAEGTHAGALTRRLAEAVSTRYLLAKAGASAGEIALCGAGDSPLGLMTDTGQAGDAVAMALLGNTARTLLMVAATPIAPGDPVFTAAAGRIQTTPTTPAIVYQVGRALTEATAAGQLVEVEPSYPRKTDVLLQFTDDASTAAMYLASAFHQGVERIISLN